MNPIRLMYRYSTDWIRKVIADRAEKKRIAEFEHNRYLMRLAARYTVDACNRVKKRPQLTRHYAQMIEEVHARR
jgi:hypothetical protein